MLFPLRYRGSAVCLHLLACALHGCVGQAAGEASGADPAICAATKKELQSLQEQRKAFHDGEVARIAKFEEERIKRERKAKRGAKGKKK